MASMGTMVPPTDAPPLDEAADHVLSDDVNWLLNRVWLGFGERRAAALDALDLTVREHVVLDVLSRVDATQLQLGAIARIDKSALTLTIDSLERKGLVVREPDPRDRRAKRPRLTPLGRDRCAAASRVSRQVQDQILDSLPKATREIFVSTLREYAFGQFSQATYFAQSR